MPNIEYVRTETRERVVSLVDALVAKGYSRADAMVRAGHQVGRSSAWVERIIGRSDKVTVTALDWLKLENLIAKIDASTSKINKNTALVLERKREAKKRKPSDQIDFSLGEGFAPEFLRARGVVK